MVNEYRIKEAIIAGAATGSLGGGSAFSIGSTSEVINGEILCVAFRSNTVTGSIFLTGSNTLGQEVIWGKVAVSGTGYQVAYPGVVPVDNTNTALSTDSGLTFTNRA